MLWCWDESFAMALQWLNVSPQAPAVTSLILHRGQCLAPVDNAAERFPHWSAPCHPRQGKDAEGFGLNANDRIFSFLPLSHPSARDIDAQTSSHSPPALGPTTLTLRGQVAWVDEAAGSSWCPALSNWSCVPKTTDTVQRVCAGSDGGWVRSWLRGARDPGLGML